jgi:autotransporter-associated beta strand protein
VIFIRWNSTSSGAWDITNSFNWFNPFTGLNDVFEQSDKVLFDDTPGVVTNVTIDAGVAVMPAVVTNDSSANNFAISGAGSISGASSIVKKGTSTLTLSTSNDFTGDVIVLGGAVRVDHNAALGDATGRTVVNSGATLDLGGSSFGINGLNLINEVIMVSGAGVNGQGAIINSSSTAQDNALHTVVLTGDTTFGGPGDATGGGNTPGRWDIRNTGGPASLITSNQPYNLTKVGSNQVTLVNVTVDSTLANIEVRAGTFGVQGSTTLGNPANTLTVFPGALLHLTSFTVVPSKVVVLKNGATVDSTSANNTFGGPITLQGSNTFNVTAASLTLTNVLGGTGSLNKLGGSTLVLSANNTFTGGTVVGAGTLVLTNLGSIFGSSNVSVSAGATLNARARTDGMLTLVAGQTLTGNGTVLGSVTVGPDAAISPGSSVGALTVTNVVTLQGTTFMELSKSANTNDVLRGAASIVYGGTLSLTNLSGTLAASDVFKLFYATSYSGAFTKLVPPMPGSGLAWGTGTLTSDGTLRVVAAPRPVINSLALAGGNLVSSGTNGIPNALYYVLSSTSVGLPLTNWTRLATNVFAADGSFAFTNAIEPTAPLRFYVLELP